MYTMPDIYKEYCKENTKVDQLTFSNICSDFNMLIIEYILTGKKFNMGNNLSFVSIIRIDRNNVKPRVDWGESNKYKKRIIKRRKKII